MEKLARIAPTDAEVLITGPTGVGKEEYARYLHEQSRRSRARFVPVNCGAYPSQLFENELFGHVAGAFTGATPAARGLVEEAEGGTMLLDEVDALAPENQVKLLRFIQEREYRRLGESRLRRADVRIVAATNADLARNVEQGRFRADLFFRLRVVPIHVPPLRERLDDVAPLMEHFLRVYACRYGVDPPVLSPAARARLGTYAWPGNVRELENCIRSLTCQFAGALVSSDALELLDDVAPAPSPFVPLSLGKDLQSAKRDLVASFERAYLEQALARTHGNVSRAAKQSGKARRAFFELMRKHKMDPRAFRG